MAKAKRPSRAKPEPPPVADVESTSETSRTPSEVETWELWTGRIGRARKLRQDHERRFAIATLEAMFLGEQGQGAKELIFNHFWATLKTSRPNLYYAAPKFYVRAKPGQGAPIAEHIAATGEGVLDAIATRDLNLKKAGRLAVTQAFFRLGVLKTCYEPALVPNPKAGAQIAVVKDGYPVKDEDGETVYERDPMTGKPIVEPDEILTDEVYRWEWVDAATMLLPDEGPDMARWSWLGEEVTVLLSEAKEDARFPKAKRDLLVSNVSQGQRAAGERMRRQPMGGETEKMLRYVEVYDLRERRWRIVCEGQPFTGFLLDESIPTWIEKHPYSVLALGEPILGPDPSPWPMPFVSSWEDPQREYNILRRLIVEGAKRSARKVLYTEATFADEDEAVKALQSSGDMEAVKLQDFGQEPRMMKQDGQLPDLFRGVPLLQGDWRTITGQTGARLADPDANTATEAAFAERGANIRESDEKGLVDDWLSDAGQKMFQCVQDTLTLGTWVLLRDMSDKEFEFYAQRVYGLSPDQLQQIPGIRDVLRQRFGKQKWVEVTRETLAFQAVVTVAPGSTRPRNLDVERRQWLEFLGIIGQAPQLALSRELLKYTGEKFEGIPERMLDELYALAKTMVQVNANQAGRSQGGNANGGGANTGARSTTDGAGNLMSGFAQVGL